MFDAIRYCFVKPGQVALISLLSIGFFYLLWFLFPESPGMERVELLSTIGVVASLIYILISSILVHRTVVHTYVFFTACVSLFVGGRFIAHAMGFDLSILKMENGFFSVRRPEFVVIDLTPKEGLRLSLYIVTCLCSVHAGYMFAFWKRSESIVRPVNLQWASILQVPAIALAAASTLAFLLSFPEMYRSVQNDGYIGLYKVATSDFTTRGGAAAQYGFLLALGLAFAARNKWLVWTVLGLLAMYYIANFKLGIRGGVMGFTLLCIWLFHTKVKNINRVSLVGIPVVLAGLLMLAALGPRNPGFGEHTSLYLPWFIDNQGLTALYIHAAMQVDAYPALAYFHSIIPITPSLAALVGASVPLDQLYFGQYLSKITLAGGAYQSGFGMGWSVLADFYAYTLWVPGLYLLAAAGFGAALSKVVNSANPLIFGAHAMIFIKIMLLPRTGLYSVIPFLVVYMGILAVCYVVYRFMNKRRAMLS